MITTHRRQILLGSALAVLGAAFSNPLSAAVSDADLLSKPFKPLVGPRSRTLFVNDLSGDIDGLFAAVHAILSPSTELRGIIGTGTGRPDETARRSTDIAREILALMGKTDEIKIFEGAAAKIGADGRPAPSPGTDAIIREAMRTDTDLPLYVAVGGGLTEVASALMLEPRIADRLTLVWIGGDAYPAGGVGETNFNIDAGAAQYIYNQSTIRIWQIPRAAYGTCAVSDTELQAFVAPYGAIGKWLYRHIVDAPLRFRNALNMGETWTLGDNPLIALTALGDWGPSVTNPRPFKYERTGSSLFDTVPAPHLNKDGTFTENPNGRPIRIYKSIDNRMLFNDFFAKMRMNYGGQRG